MTCYTRVSSTRVLGANRCLDLDWQFETGGDLVLWRGADCCWLPPRARTQPSSLGCPTQLALNSPTASNQLLPKSTFSFSVASGATTTTTADCGGCGRQQRVLGHKINNASQGRRVNHHIHYVAVQPQHDCLMAANTGRGDDVEPHASKQALQPPLPPTYTRRQPPQPATQAPPRPALQQAQQQPSPQQNPLPLAALHLSPQRLARQWPARQLQQRLELVQLAKQAPRPLLARRAQR